MFWNSNLAARTVHKTPRKIANFSVFYSAGEVCVRKNWFAKILKFYRLPQTAFRAIAIKFTLCVSSKQAVAIKFQTSSRDEILRRIFKKRPSLCVCKSRKACTKFHIAALLSGYQICLPSRRVEISYRPFMLVRSKFRTDILTVHARNKRST